MGRVSVPDPLLFYTLSPVLDHRAGGHFQRVQGSPQSVDYRPRMTRLTGKGRELDLGLKLQQSRAKLGKTWLNVSL